MPRKPGNTTDAEVIKRATIDWGASSDHSVEGLADWDVKTEDLAAAILQILASGCGVIFGTTWDGTAVAISILQDREKIRSYVNDSVELDDWAAKVLAKARAVRAKQNGSVPAK